MIIDEGEYLAHYGILRRSGRYPWGSGGDTVSRSQSFLDHVSTLRKEGLSDTKIAEGFGMTTTELRAANSIARNEIKQANISMAQRLKDRGWSNTAIGERMKLNESSVRALLAPGEKDKVDVLVATSEKLKSEVDSRGYIDVGVGVERHLGISRTRLDTAIARLKEQGYELHSIQIDQLGTAGKTTVKVLAPPGTTYRDIVGNKDKIQSIAGYSTDGGRTYEAFHPPMSISSKRLAINYAEDGGTKADGVVYVRPGVKDLSLGGSNYAQVRIVIDGSHYIKGMAVYKSDLPPGVDLQFNTNKSNTGNKLDALKELKRNKETGEVDADLPFGSVIRRQVLADDGKGGKKVTSAMNLVNEEGSWDTWSRSLSSQVLSKQSPKLAEEQLRIVAERKRRELDEILSLTNPAVRRKLLEEFSDEADSASVHLKAAALPRQTSRVIMPVNSLKGNEVYAPGLRDGEQVVLIRHPHGGTFEIPELTVNNRNPEARKLLGNAADAVGIHHSVANRLSGADFDGDAVLVIPNNQKKIKTSPALDGLKDFDPIASYPAYEGMPRMSTQRKGFEMGDVSNLITDMTIKGASQSEIARAVRHSMVVIDAEKHNLNYKQSAIDNGIAQLKQKYQGKTDAGAATLISRASSRIDVENRKPRSAAKGGPIDKATGKKVFEKTGESFVNRDGKLVVAKTQSKKLAETDDAHTLSSGTKIEKIYADHSNSLKSLANEARRELVSTGNVKWSPKAKETYSKEVASLKAKLNLSLRNAPVERNAQLIANAIVQAKKQANPEMDPSEIKKLKSKALNEARARTGAGKTRIFITDAEWDAIQAGAISNNELSKILANADEKRVRDLATPRTKTLMTDSKKARATRMLASGYTQAEVADALGVSLTTLKDSLQ